GDVNADKKVDSLDYLLVKRACFGTYTLSQEEYVRANVNRDDRIDSTDYLLVKRIAFGTYTVTVK
ncbi:MAG: dockerin type I repeat-containing protein, partial [Clostridia bacterium]|nr:dockerin type I repeat-containing protein [Clostridia bacterium]